MLVGLIIGLVAIFASPIAAAQPAALAILTGIPFWVYPLFALLVYLGLQARRARELAIARLLVTPLLFLAWSLASLLLRPDAALAADWAASALAGGLLGLATLRMDGVVVDRARGRVHVPGSTLPILRNLLIFGAKFGLGLAAGLQPAARDSLALWDIAVSGASAGYFIAWLWRFGRAYGRARHDVNQGSEPAPMPQSRRLPGTQEG